MKRIFIIDKGVSFESSDETVGYRNETYKAMEFIEGFFNDNIYLDKDDKFKKKHTIKVEIK